MELADAEAVTVATELTGVIVLVAVVVQPLADEAVMVNVVVAFNGNVVIFDPTVWVNILAGDQT